jgi:hypothetical protein
MKRTKSSSKRSRKYPLAVFPLCNLMVNGMMLNRGFKGMVLKPRPILGCGKLFRVSLRIGSPEFQSQFSMNQASAAALALIADKRAMAAKD